MTKAFRITLYLVLASLLFACTFPGKVKFRKTATGKWEAYEIEANSDMIDRSEINHLENILNGN